MQLFKKKRVDEAAEMIAKKLGVAPLIDEAFMVVPVEPNDERRRFTIIGNEEVLRRIQQRDGWTGPSDAEASD